MNRYLVYIGFLLLMTACDTATNRKIEEGKTVYAPRYAKYFRIDYFDHYKKISIFNPWNNNTMDMEYLVATDSTAIPDTLRNSGAVVTPFPKGVVCLSSPLVGLMNMLHLNTYIGGVSDPEYIYDSVIKYKIERGAIVNVGKSIQVNMEQIIALHPALVFASGWDQMSADYKKMMQLHLRPVFMYDWQEVHPLGKAEWMILMAAFFNREAAAKKLFTHIEADYLKLKNSVVQANKPSVFNGSEYQGIWYSAGGKSYMSQLYSDAGSNYILHSDSSQASINLDFEVLLNKAINTDIWMYTSGIQKENLQILYTEKYKHMKAVINHQVYSYHKRVNDSGANDYFETGSWKPNVVLGDLIWIFHPELRNQIEPYYFNQVQY